MIDQMQDEIERLRAQVTRLQAEGTAELLKHREEKAGMLQKIADQKNLIHGLNTRHLADVTRAGERDRRIAELEGVLRSVQDRLQHREDIREVCYDSCPRCAVNAALAGKGVSR